MYYNLQIATMVVIPIAKLQVMTIIMCAKMMSSDVLGLLLRPSADYNLRHKTVAFRLGRPFATTLNRCL